MEPSQTNELEHAVICPHCNEPILIEKLNCCIFRHGIMKDTLHLLSFKTPIYFYIVFYKILKDVKSIVGISPTMV